jgi:hypothetical protein
MSKDARGVGCLILFALPFAAVGLVVGGMAAWTLWSWADAQSWEQVPATLLEVQLITQGGDTDTYRVEATYEYRWRGETYVSDRVWYQAMADNIGSFHHDAELELRAYLDAGRPFPAWVNPDDPSESVLFREMRWLLMLFEAAFGLIFGGVGFGLIAAALWGSRRQREQERRQEELPGEPWRWREEWSSGRIAAGSGAERWAALLFATFWNLMSWPVVLAVPRELAEGDRLVLIALIFPAVGVGLAAWAVVATVRWHRYGRAEAVLDTVPGVIGGHLSGRIATAVRDLDVEALRLVLTCERRTQGRDGSRRALWQDTARVARAEVVHGAGGLEIPFDFVIPYDARSTTEPSEEGATVRWNLEAHGARPGIDYRVRFEVPVFRTPESDPAMTGAGEREPTEPLALQRDLESAGIASAMTPDGSRRLVFARARHKKAAAGLTAFLVIWWGAIVLMWHLGAPLFFPVVFLLFAVPLTWAALDMWLSRNVVTASPTELSRTGGLLGRTRVVPADTVDAIEVSSGTQAGEQLFYRLHAVTADQRKVLIATMLDDQRIARLVADQLRDALGLADRGA